MAVAIPGQSISFALNALTPTQLALANDQRRYILITSNAKVAIVYVAIGSQNQAVALLLGSALGHHAIPPGGFLTIGPIEPGWLLKSDIAAIAGGPDVSLTTDSTDNFAAGTRTFTPAAMSGVVNGVPWVIQAGSILVMDTGANQETVTVTAVTATTFTCVTTKAHNGTVTPFSIFSVPVIAYTEA